MQTSEESSDRRSGQRNRVYWGAEIYLNDFFEPYGCLVRDFSVEGARIKLDQNARLPQEFRLWVASRQMHVRARMIWRDEQIAGLRFEGFEPPRASREVPVAPPPPVLRRGFSAAG